MKKVLLIVLLLTGFLLESLAQTNGQAIGQLFTKYTQEEGIHNAFFRIETVDQSILLDTVMGKFATGEKPTLNTPFYTASIGKTFTATAISQLVDEGKLSFDDRVVDHLDTLLEGLLVIDGVDYTPDLTIHHLLSHTSGLPDYFEDPPVKGVNMMQKLLMEPNRFWEPVDLIHFTKKHFKGQFKPGQGYHYSDTEYVLLGLIVEKVSGLPLHEYFQQYIFRPLGMNLSSMNLRSKPIRTPDFPMAEIYAGPMEISQFQSLSADWAGGAIRSTGEDLNTFLKALFQGTLISKGSFSKMQQWIPESQGTYYGYGLRKWVLNELSDSIPTLTLIGHSGATGAYLYYCPELGLYISGTFNNTDYLRQHIVFIAELLSLFGQNSK